MRSDLTKPNHYERIIYYYVINNYVIFGLADEGQRQPAYRGEETRGYSAPEPAVDPYVPPPAPVPAPAAPAPPTSVGDIIYYLDYWC